MPIRLIDVAAHAGVSVATVSHVLGGKFADRYTTETRQTIEASARALGYRPNNSARAMRSGQSGAVTLLLPADTGASFLPARLLAGIHDALAEQGRHLIVARYPDEKLIEADFVPRALKECMADGLIVNYIDKIPPAFAEALALPGAPPTVWLNVDRPFDCTRPDDEQGGYDMTRLLIENGHTQIAYIGVQTGHYSVVARQSGYTKAMKERELTPRIIMYEYPEKIFENVGLLWDKKAKEYEPITGVVAYESFVVIPLLIILARQGIRVPEEVSVVTFYDTDIDWNLGLSVTTAVIPVYEMGQRAVEMLAQKLAGEPNPIPSTLVPITIYTGTTVASCKN
jgi:LacI family transcriptional regulator